jgi:hypothetical protein
MGQRAKEAGHSSQSETWTYLVLLFNSTTNDHENRQIKRKRKQKSCKSPPFLTMPLSPLPTIPSPSTVCAHQSIRLADKKIFAHSYQVKHTPITSTFGHLSLFSPPPRRVTRTHISLCMKIPLFTDFQGLVGSHSVKLKWRNSCTVRSTS